MSEITPEHAERLFGGSTRAFAPDERPYTPHPAPDAAEGWVMADGEWQSGNGGWRTNWRIVTEYDAHYESVWFTADEIARMSNDGEAIPDRARRFEYRRWGCNLYRRPVPAAFVDAGAPDERPPEPLDDEGVRRVQLEISATVNREAERVVRQIAWDAAEAYALHQMARASGSPLTAVNIRDAFLAGGRA